MEVVSVVRPLDSVLAVITGIGWTPPQQTQKIRYVELGC